MKAPTWERSTGALLDHIVSNRQTTLEHLFTTRLHAAACRQFGLPEGTVIRWTDGPVDAMVNGLTFRAPCPMQGHYVEPVIPALGVFGQCRVEVFEAGTTASKFDDYYSQTSAVQSIHRTIGPGTYLSLLGCDAGTVYAGYNLDNAISTIADIEVYLNGATTPLPKANAAAGWTVPTVVSDAFTYQGHKRLLVFVPPGTTPSSLEAVAANGMRWRISSLPRLDAVAWSGGVLTGTGVFPSAAAAMLKEAGNVSGCALTQQDPALSNTSNKISGEDPGWAPNATSRSTTEIAWAPWMSKSAGKRYSAFFFFLDAVFDHGDYVNGYAHSGLGYQIMGAARFFIA